MSSREAQIVELARWLQTPPGRYLLDWEQRQVDEAVVDLFGFNALQLGLPELQGLRANRMRHRWLALDSVEQFVLPAPSPEDDAATGHDPAPQGRFSQFDSSSLLVEAGPTLRCAFDALPFESNSLDLIVLPHALELADDPHQTLREVERVLRPEGRLVILGLNPASLWGLRQNLGRLRRHVWPGSPDGLFLPRAGEFIGYWRLRDWLRLLNFEVERAQFGCYRPPLRTEPWLKRWQWMEEAGMRWWTVFGAVYFMVAVKRVHGMRLVGLARNKKLAAKAAPAVAMHPHPRDISSPDS